MSFVLYYRTKTACAVTHRILSTIAGSEVRRQIYFVNVDDMVTSSPATGFTVRHARLVSGAQILIPPMMQTFPAMIVLGSNNLMVERDDILRMLSPIIEQEAMMHNSHMSAQSMVGSGAAGPMPVAAAMGGAPAAAGPPLPLDTTKMGPMSNGKYKTFEGEMTETMRLAQQLESSRDREDAELQARFRAMNGLPPVTNAVVPEPRWVGGARREVPPNGAPAAATLPAVADADTDHYLG